MSQLKEPNLNSYALWKLITTVLFIMFCIYGPGNFYERLPTFLIFCQLIAIEALITARFDGIIQ